jgi:ribonuclease T1
MSRRWTIGFLVLSFLWGLGSLGARDDGSWAHFPQLAPAESQTSPAAIEERPSSGPTGRIRRNAPQKAYDLLAKLQQRDGKPLPGYIGGREFQNRERRLPRGRYREYDVNRKVPGQSRDAERIVIEQKTGKAYYTDDHYRTFILMN